MLVVADTTPLNYLVLVEAVDVLSVLFGRVCIPQEVQVELSRPSAPAPVRRWVSDPPSWLETVAAQTYPGLPASIVSSLDPGEVAALALALELKPDFVLIDERAGSRAARDLGLRTTGTLGVIEMAAKRGLVDLEAIIGRLRLTNFRYPSEIVERLLAEELRRKRGPA
jgi:predicted nucleic acid-binding protein